MKNLWKHAVTNKDEAYNLEYKELNNNYKISPFAKRYIEKLNEKFQNQKVKFFYWKELFFHENPEESDWILILIVKVLK